MSEAILPLRWMRTTSSAVRASSKVSGWSSLRRCTTSICSSTARTASAPFNVAGT
jgi:hypothetical protein